MLKKTLIALYIVVVAVMAAATIVEKYQGTDFVSGRIYGAWWFCLLWAALAAIAVVYFLSRRVRRLSVVVLHLSFVVILAGALLTHLTASQGIVHLRMGEATDRYTVVTEDGTTEKELPFSIRLDRFEVSYHAGTRAAADYASHFTIAHGNRQEKGQVSMNNIFSYSNIRLYQSSYDDDEQGSYLSVNSDPWGIPVTYAGYTLLFIALVWILVDPRGSYRQLWRSPLLKKGTLVFLLLVGIQPSLPASRILATTAPVLPRETAEAFGRLHVRYNNRICPMQTFAIDFTKKLYGKSSYKGCTAEQVLTGFLFWGDEWSKEPIIKMKSSPLTEQLHLPKYCSVNAFFGTGGDGYLIGPLLQEYYQGQNDKLHQEAAKADDRLRIIMELRQGKPLSVFPYADRRRPADINWYGPADKYPDGMEPERQQYMQNIFALLYQDARTGNYAQMDEALQKMQKYQLRYGGSSIPSPTRVRAERIYNRIPFATLLFMVNLTMGLLTLFLTIRRTARNWLTSSIFVLSWLALTFCLALRWTVTGHIPMANGYETMLLMAWFTMLLSLIASRRFPIMLMFGFLLSGFFLLVSHIGQMDPQISHIMPVLNSPLLSIHVSVIMMAFALLSLTFVCGVAGVGCWFGARGGESSAAVARLTLLSRLFLYPALSLLGIGIFVGAIWANLSWGTYWSWDPKEVWALITFMVYAVVLHQQSLPTLRKPLGYHVFCIVAFLTLLMTYFGVNYFLGGMHSYA